MLRVMPLRVHRHLLLVGLMVLSLPVWSAPPSPVSTAKPNILLLLADDFGFNDSGLYQDLYGQKPVAPMPALESLAEEGIRFSRFYTESTCSASRVALLTGQFPARHGFIPAGRGISPDVLTLADYLQARGYRTHHVGKWHAGEFHGQAYPEAQGFLTSFGFLNQWMLQGPDPQGQPQLKAPTYRNPWLRNESGAVKPKQGHLEDLLTQHTLQLIQQQQKQQPWFIYHAFLAPHSPLQPEESYARRFADTPEGKHLALLAQLDDNLQKMFATLKETKQWDNTIIIFASDNGSQAQHTQSNAPFSGGKARYDEGGIRAPLVIKWHASLQTGRETRQDPVSILDVYASLREVLGTAPASLPTMHLDGRASLLPGSTPEKIPSLNAFYSFNALSIFEPSVQKRLIREWDSEVWSRNEHIHYDDRGGVLAEREPFWRKWFGKDETEKNLQMEKFLHWRDQVRQVEIQSVPVKEGKSSMPLRVSGSDFLRTPMNPAYALAFDVSPQAEWGKQILLSQRNIMEVTWEKGTLSAQVHGMVVKAEGLQAGQCYRVVLSGEFYDRYSNVQETLLPSRLHLVVNSIRRDTAEATLDSLMGLDISTPHIAQGIHQLRFFTTQLLPAVMPVPLDLEPVKSSCSSSVGL